MPVRPVVRAPAPGLSTPCTPVDPRDPGIVALAADLVETMRAHPACIGIAANQVGDGRRVVVLDVTHHPRARSVHGLLQLANPELVEASRWERGREGCLSVPDLTGDVRRARRVTVRAEEPGTGAELVIRAEGFEAVALQHELDHVDGLLFLDRLAGPHALHARVRYQ